MPSWGCLSALAIDVRSAALFRICIAVILLLDLSVRAGDMVAFYSETGVAPAGAVSVFRMGDTLMSSFHFIAGSMAATKALFLVSAAAYFSLLLGYHSQISCFASWLMVTSMQNRNLLVLNAGDDLLRLALFWAFFMPLSRCWSLDAFFLEGCSEKERKRKEVSVGGVALRLQLAWMYLESYVTKVGDAWQSGDAVWFALHDEEFTTRTGFAVLALIPPPVLRVMAKATVLLELLLPALLLFPLVSWTFGRMPAGVTGRWTAGAAASFAAVLLILSLHFGFGMCLEIGFFPYIPMAVGVLFTPSAAWDLLTYGRDSKKDGRRLRVTARRSYAVLVRLLASLLGIEEVVEVNVEKRVLFGVEVWEEELGREGGRRNGWLALVAIGMERWDMHSRSQGWMGRKIKGRMVSCCLLLPLLFLFLLVTSLLVAPLLPLAMLAASLVFVGVLVSERTNGAVAWGLSRMMDVAVPAARLHKRAGGGGGRAGRLQKAVGMTLVIYTAFWVSIPYTHYQGPLWPYVSFLGPVLRVEQYWTMFAPEPPMQTGWWLAIATLQSGREVDYFGDYCAQMPFGDASHGIFSALWLGGGGSSVWEALGWQTHCEGKEVDRRREAQPWLLSTSFRTQRWRKYFMNMRQQRFAPWAGEEYLRFVCQQVNGREGGERATEMRLEYVQRAIPMPGEEEPMAEPFLVASIPCPTSETR